LKALALYPNDSSIHLKYAGFLRHIRRDLNESENHYRKAAEVNPLNPDAAGSYASFMHGVLRKMDIAEEMYVKAIEVSNLTCRVANDNDVDRSG